MDGTTEHYAKGNKPGSERQIPYDLTYKWNLTNKTNKQAKYNQSQVNSFFAPKLTPSLFPGLGLIIRRKEKKKKKG